MKFGIVTGDYDTNLTFYLFFRKTRRQFSQVAPLHPLEFLRQFDAHGCHPIAQHDVRVGQQLADAEGGLVNHHSVGAICILLNPALAGPAFPWREALEYKTRGGQARGQQGRGDGRWARKDIHGVPGFPAIANNAIAWVAHTWTAAIAAEANRQSFVQETQYPLAGLLFVVLVVTEGGPGPLDLVALQQTLGHARVFTGEGVHFLEHAVGSIGEVLQVTDGGGYDK